MTVPVLHGVGVGETLDNLGDGGSLLSDGDVDAVELLLLVSGLVEALLVDDGVDGDGGLAGLTITDDQLTLASADGHERVDGLDASLERQSTRVKIRITCNLKVVNKKGWTLKEKCPNLSGIHWKMPYYVTM